MNCNPLYQNITRTIVLMLDKVDFKAWDKDLCTISIKRSFQQNIIILNLCAFNNIATIYMKLKLTKLKKYVHKFTSRYKTLTCLSCDN